MNIRFKYFAKAALFGLFSAALVILAVFALTNDEMTLRVRSEELYEQIRASAQPLIIDVNTASVRELQKLNGIGEVTANAIVAYRAEYGAFNSGEELLNVKGIGKATLEKILPYISL